MWYEIRWYTFLILVVFGGILVSDFLEHKHTIDKEIRDKQMLRDGYVQYSRCVQHEIVWGLPGIKGE